MLLRPLVLALIGLVLVGPLSPATELPTDLVGLAALNAAPRGPSPQELASEVVSPGSQSGLAPPSAHAGNDVPFQLPETPYTELLGRLHAGADQTPATFVAAVADYFGTMRGAEASGGSTFEENSTRSFTFGVGDVTNDTVDDIVLDTYCVSRDGCSDLGGGLPVGLPGRAADPALPLGIPGLGACSLPPHRLSAVNGLTGAPLWNLTFVYPNDVQVGQVGSCTADFVLGTFPVADGSPVLLLYQYSVTSVSVSVMKLQHTIYFVDPHTGKTKGTPHVEEGKYVALNGDPRVVHAENLLVNPIVQVPPQAGLDVLPHGTQPTLHLQGVGFDLVYASSLQTLPGFTGPFPIVFSYQPHEWADRIDVPSGKELWRADTFKPQDDRSVMPSLLRVDALPRDLPSRSPLVRAAYYWNYRACCFDTTGDHIPDLAYTTFEWSTTPSTNNQGPYFVASRLVLFDGAKGGQYGESVIEKGTDVTLLQVYTEALGDANGDGASDLLVHAVYASFGPDQTRNDFRHVLSVRSGTDASEVWRLESPRDLAAIVLGDADRDGRNDFVVFDWFRTAYGLTNVTNAMLTGYSGADGRLLWRTSTFAAPVDLAALFNTLRFNGLPDYNQDGVADFAIDDPLYLPDLTVVHRETFVSGRDASPLFRFINVGTFAFPARVGDITGDGRDDLAVLNGDLLDLWLTAYDGTHGQPVWSRRILAPKLSSALSSVPMLHFLAIRHGDHPVEDVFVNLHLVVGSAGGGFYTPTVTPLMTAYDGANGTAHWAIPGLDDATGGLVAGASPASATFQHAFDALAAASASTPGHVGFGAAFGGAIFAAAFLVSYIATRRWKA